MCCVVLAIKPAALKCGFRPAPVVPQPRRRQRSHCRVARRGRLPGRQGRRKAAAAAGRTAAVLHFLVGHLRDPGPGGDVTLGPLPAGRRALRLPGPRAVPGAAAAHRAAPHRAAHHRPHAVSHVIRVAPSRLARERTSRESRV